MPAWLDWLGQWLEPEERVGHIGSRLLQAKAPYPRYPEAACDFASQAQALRLFFRAVGGPAGIRLLATGNAAGTNRRNWREKLAGANVRLPRARCSEQTLLLPAKIELFPTYQDNRQLYFWLCAFLSQPPPPEPCAASPLQQDIQRITQAMATTTRLLQRFPGLIHHYRRLCRQLLQGRPDRPLPPQEQAVEIYIRQWLAFSCNPTLGKPDLSPDLILEQPRGYQTFLPVPLWGEWLRTNSGEGSQSSLPDREIQPTEPAAKEPSSSTEQAYQARRNRFDQTERDDPLVLNRFEKLLSWCEMFNLNRAVDQDQDSSQSRAADDLDHLDLAPHRQSARHFLGLNLALDLTPAEQRQRDSGDGLKLPEWDFRRGDYLPNCCVVYVQAVEPAVSPVALSPEQQRLVAPLRRRFGSLRSDPGWQRRLLTGDELDLDPLIEDRLDRLARGFGHGRCYAGFSRQQRDLSIAVLLDSSLSTDSWVRGQRVLDIELQALTLLAQALDAGPDPFAILAFSSRLAELVTLHRVKGFDEAFSATTLRRIAALTPGHYTRMGAALRYAQMQLTAQASRRRLLLILTDGKPNDLDHYEGRYGLEDTRRAILEARATGTCVFGITIDSAARDYFPYLFGLGHYAMLPHAERLPGLIPQLLYRLLHG